MLCSWPHLSSHGNLFSLTRNLAPSTVVTFTFAYEELLPTRAGLYEQTVNIDLEKVRETKLFQINAAITDSRNITVLRALEMNSDMTIDQGILLNM